MDFLLRPWIYALVVMMATIVVAVEFVDRWKRGPNRPPVPWSKRLLVLATCGGAIVLTILSFEFPILVTLLLRLQWVLVGLLALILVFGFLWILYTGHAANSVLKQAEELDAAGRHGEAIALLERHVDQQSGRDKTLGALMLMNMALIHGRHQEWRSADLALDRALTLVPNDPLLHTTRATLLCDRGEPERAFVLVEPIVSEFPKCAPLHTLYAELLIARDDLDRAAPVIDHIARLLDSRELVGVVNPAQWKAEKLQPLQDALAKAATDSG